MATTMLGTLAVSNKAKCAHSQPLGNFTLGVTYSTGAPKDIDRHVHSSFTGPDQRLESFQISNNRRMDEMDKLVVVSSHNGLYTAMRMNYILLHTQDSHNVEQ